MCSCQLTTCSGLSVNEKYVKIISCTSGFSLFPHKVLKDYQMILFLYCWPMCIVYNV